MIIFFQLCAESTQVEQKSGWHTVTGSITSFWRKCPISFSKSCVKSGKQAKSGNSRYVFFQGPTENPSEKATENLTEKTC